MAQGKKFNYKVERAADDALQYMMNKQFDIAFEIATINLKKKNKHPVFLFVKSIEALLQGDESSFRAQFDNLFKLSSARYTDYYNFGVFFQQHKLDNLAVECLSKCVELKRDFFEGQEQLGNSIYFLGEYESALGAYSAALELRPKNKTLIMRAGECCSKLGYDTDGLAYYQSLLLDHPRDSDVRTGFASCLIRLGRESEAVAFLGKDIDQSYEPEKDYYVLSLISYKTSKLHAALKFAAKAYEINSDYLPVLKLYGAVLGRLNIHGLAIDILKKALEKDPDDPEVLFNCGNSYQGITEIDQAREYYLECLGHDPEYYLAFNNLGFGYNFQGNIEKAKECYGIAMELAPSREDFHSNLLFTILHEKNSSPEDHLREARLWQSKHAIPIDERVQAYKFNTNEVKKLRIGYISGDFGDHVAAYYWLPVAQHHDRDRYDIFLYSQKPREDDSSGKIKIEIEKVCDKIRDVSNLSDKELCEQIVDDQIHILIDLSGHTAGGRLRALSYKPAPVQASYIGYPATTGLDSIDYYISQPFSVPLEHEDLFSEKLAHIAGCTSYSVRPGAEKIESKKLPYKENGFITFANFNRAGKVTAECMRAWGQILQQVPNSKLMLKINRLDEDDFTNDFYECLDDLGVERGRLILRTRSDFLLYLEEINEFDLGLDPFPYNGASTSLDLFYMGRSFVSLTKGRAFHENIGTSLLKFFGQEEMIVSSVEKYIERAVWAANNMAVLEENRLKLRSFFLTEVAGGGAKVCASLERAMDVMWKRYCKGDNVDHITLDDSER
ncbi:hypothetical protein WH96_14210 [Kiloniella spongiae]|uniref:protein O-GlcNAc transferase n=1 Tax=Kiloniella spongiae TaxID=1489064 RepID=A0A0H2MUC1_9PROT|nr:hypothetical protein [Kiloniella spongiae]KLN60320.1 hypothetical protein WH96_14210 [Kiloniella spongiae]